MTVKGSYSKPRSCRADNIHVQQHSAADRRTRFYLVIKCALLIRIKFPRTCPSSADGTSTYSNLIAALMHGGGCIE